VALLIGIMGPLATLAAMRGWETAGFGAILVAQLVAGPITLALGVRWSGLSLQGAFAVRRFPARVLPSLMLASFGLAIVLGELARRIPGWKDFRDAIVNGLGQSGMLAAILAALVAAPVLEELLCRGVLLRGLLRRHSAWTAASVTALVFAVVHLNPWQGVVALPLGLAFAWLAIRTGSVLPGIVAHAVVNSSSLLVAAMLLASGYRRADLAKLEHLPLALVAGGAVAAVLGAAGVWRQLRDYRPATGDADAAGSSFLYREPESAALRVAVTIAAAVAIVAATPAVTRGLSRDVSLPAGSVAAVAGCYAAELPRPVAAELFPGVNVSLVRLRLSAVRYQVGLENPARYLVQRLDTAPAQPPPSPGAAPVFWIPLRSGKVSVVGAHTLLRLRLRGADLAGAAVDYLGPAGAWAAPAGAVSARRIPCPAPATAPGVAPGGPPGPPGSPPPG
jgi:membrane protease YdiL (CAAX protease family)